MLTDDAGSQLLTCMHNDIKQHMMRPPTCGVEDCSDANCRKHSQDDHTDADRGACMRCWRWNCNRNIESHVPSLAADLPQRDTELVSLLVICLQHAMRMKLLPAILWHVPWMHQPRSGPIRMHATMLYRPHTWGRHTERGTR